MSASKDNIYKEKLLFDAALPDDNTSQKYDQFNSFQINRVKGNQIPSIPDTILDVQQTVILQSDQPIVVSPSKRHQNMRRSLRVNVNLEQQGTIKSNPSSLFLNKNMGSFIQVVRSAQEQSPTYSGRFRSSNKLMTQSSSPRKKSKNALNFNVYIKTLKAIRQFKQFIIPRQIPIKALKYIKDLSYYENLIGSTNQLNQVQRLKLFYTIQEKSNVLFLVVKQINKYLNRVIQYFFNLIDSAIPVIDPLNPSRILFDMFVVAIIIFAVFFNTIEVFFAIRFLDVYPKAFPLTNQLFIVILLFNIFLNMSTGVYYKGVISKSRQKILQFYLKTQFLIDFLAISSLIQFPETFFYLEWVSKLFILLKIPQVTSKLNLAMQITQQTDSKIFYVVRLFKLFLTLIFVAHLMAICFYGQTLIFSRFDPHLETWVSQNKIVQENDLWTTKYIFSLYFSVTTMVTVGYGDITPVNKYEALLVIISMVIASGIFAYTFNLIGTIVADMNKKEKLYKKKVQMLNIYLTDRNIDPDLKYQVQKFLEYKFQSDQELSKEEEQKVLSDLSTNLLERINFQAKKKVLNRASNIFSLFSQEMRDLICLELKEIRPSKDEVIFEINSTDEDPRMYFIHRGSVDISLKIPNNKEPEGALLSTMQQGQFFGEICFLTNQPRLASAKANESSILFCLSQNDFLRILKTDKKEIEKYYQLITKIIFNQTNTQISTQCFYCQKETHYIDRCPFVHFCPDKELVILKNSYSIPTLERQTFDRYSYKYCSLLDVESKKEQAIMLRKEIRKKANSQRKSLLKQSDDKASGERNSSHADMTASHIRFSRKTIQRRNCFTQGDPAVVENSSDQIESSENSQSEDMIGQTDNFIPSQYYSSNGKANVGWYSAEGGSSESESIPEEGNNSDIIKIKSQNKQCMNNQQNQYGGDNRVIIAKDQNQQNEQQELTQEMVKQIPSILKGDIHNHITKTRTSSIYFNAFQNSNDFKYQQQQTYSLKRSTTSRQKKQNSIIKQQLQNSSNNILPPMRSLSQPKPILHNFNLQKSVIQANIQPITPNSATKIALPNQDISTFGDDNTNPPKSKQSSQSSRSHKPSQQNPKQKVLKQTSIGTDGLLQIGLFGEDDEKNKIFFEESLRCFDLMREFDNYFPSSNYKNIIQQYNKVRVLQNQQLPSYFGVYSFVNRKDKRFKSKVMFGIKKLKIGSPL